MRIAIVGSGYVGIVTGGCFAKLGHEVLFHDLNAEALPDCEWGPNFYEPGLADILRQHRFMTTLKPSDVADFAPHFTFLCIGTPEGAGGRPDLTALIDAASAMSAAKVPGVCVVKSTVPPGTAGAIKTCWPDADAVLSNPEFLAEGRAVADFLKPDRVVIGHAPADLEAAKVLKSLYAPVTRTGAPTLFMSNAEAELVKLVSNSFLAMKISYINAVAKVCHQLSVDVEQVRRGAGADKRVGSSFLFPGIGFGGSCFHKDVSNFWTLAQDLRAGELARMLDTVLTTNDQILALFHAQIAKRLPPGAKVGVLGVAFKPETDDIRDSQAVRLAEMLCDSGFVVSTIDPRAKLAPYESAGRITRRARVENVAAGASALVLATEWSAFQRLNWPMLHDLMDAPHLFADGRNIWPRDAGLKNFNYIGVGR